MQNIRLSNCEYFPDVVNAIFRRIPGKVEAENFGHKGFGLSYFVKDTSQYSKFYRSSEFVSIDTFSVHRDSRVSEQSIYLEEDEWIVYEINSLNSIDLNGTVKIKTANEPAKFLLELNGQVKELDLLDENWVIKNLDSLNFKQGINKLKLVVKRGSINMDWFLFK